MGDYLRKEYGSEPIALEIAQEMEEKIWNDNFTISFSEFQELMAKYGAINKKIVHWDFIDEECDKVGFFSTFSPKDTTEPLLIVSVKEYKKDNGGCVRNFDKYEKELKEFGTNFAYDVRTNRIVHCDNAIGCTNCKFTKYSRKDLRMCELNKMEWLYEKAKPNLEECFDCAHSFINPLLDYQLCCKKKGYHPCEPNYVICGQFKKKEDNG